MFKKRVAAESTIGLNYSDLWNGVEWQVQKGKKLPIEGHPLKQSPCFATSIDFANKAYITDNLI